MADAFSVALTAKQRVMVEHGARLLWIGTATKTGKTTGLGVWIADGLLAGQATAWVGPWFARTRSGFETLRGLLQPLIASGRVRATETLLRMRDTQSGGTFECYSADNPQALFGGNFHRLVLDEASRMPADILAAALTTISATEGKMRCAFNLELGSRNWAIASLLRVQAMTPEQRSLAGEDFLTFPTDPALVSRQTVEAMRRAMPEVLWRALYLAQIPSDDVSLFRNLDEVFSGMELDAPLAGHSYVAGIDLARKRNFTVVTVLDADSGDVVEGDRFSEISWALQCDRVVALSKRFKCSKVFVDATGLGDVIVEALQEAGLRIEPVIFTQRERTELVERLVVACDKVEIRVPGTDKFQAWRHELESFECQLDGTASRYVAASGAHDDCVMSLALALKGKRAGLVLGLVGFLKDLAQKPGYLEAMFPERKPATPRDDNLNKRTQLEIEMKLRGIGRSAPAENYVEPREPCSRCGATCTTRIGGCGLHCNACGFSDGSGVIVQRPPSRSEILRRMRC